MERYIGLVKAYLPHTNRARLDKSLANRAIRTEHLNHLPIINAPQKANDPPKYDSTFPIPLLNSTYKYNVPSHFIKLVKKFVNPRSRTDEDWEQTLNWQVIGYTKLHLS